MHCCSPRPQSASHAEREVKHSSGHSIGSGSGSTGAVAASTVGGAGSSGPASGRPASRGSGSATGGTSTGSATTAASRSAAVTGGPASTGYDGDGSGEPCPPVFDALGGAVLPRPPLAAMPPSPALASGVLLPGSGKGCSVRGGLSDRAEPVAAPASARPVTPVRRFPSSTPNWSKSCVQAARASPRPSAPSRNRVTAAPKGSHRLAPDGPRASRFLHGPVRRATRVSPPCRLRRCRRRAPRWPTSARAGRVR